MIRLLSHILLLPAAVAGVPSVELTVDRFLGVLEVGQSYFLETPVENETGENWPVSDVQSECGCVIAEVEPTMVPPKSVVTLRVLVQPDRAREMGSRIDLLSGTEVVAALRLRATFVDPVPPRDPGIPGVSPREVIDSDEVLMLDLRSPAEFQRMRIPGSINLSAHRLSASPVFRGPARIVIVNDLGIREIENLDPAEARRGRPQLAYLDGGLYGWHLAGGALTGTRVDPVRANFVSSSEAGRILSARGPQVVGGNRETADEIFFLRPESLDNFSDTILTEATRSESQGVEPVVVWLDDFEDLYQIEARLRGSTAVRPYIVNDSIGDASARNLRALQGSISAIQTETHSSLNAGISRPGVTSLTRRSSSGSGCGGCP